MENFRIVKPKSLNGLKVNIFFDIDSDYKVSQSIKSETCLHMIFATVSSETAQLPLAKDNTRFHPDSGN